MHLHTTIQWTLRVAAINADNTLTRRECAGKHFHHHYCTLKTTCVILLSKSHGARVHLCKLGKISRYLLIGKRDLTFVKTFRLLSRLVESSFLVHKRDAISRLDLVG